MQFESFIRSLGKKSQLHQGDLCRADSTPWRVLFLHKECFSSHGTSRKVQNVQRMKGFQSQVYLKTPLNSQKMVPSDWISGWARCRTWEKKWKEKKQIFLWRNRICDVWSIDFFRRKIPRKVSYGPRFTTQRVMTDQRQIHQDQVCRPTELCFISHVLWALILHHLFKREIWFFLWFPFWFVQIVTFLPRNVLIRSTPFRSNVFTFQVPRPSLRGSNGLKESNGSKRRSLHFLMKKTKKIIFETSLKRLFVRLVSTFTHRRDYQKPSWAGKSSLESLSIDLIINGEVGLDSF